MRDSLNSIQGNDLGAGWIDHHTDLLLLFALLYGMVNLSEDDDQNLVRALEWYNDFPLYKAAFANRRLYGEVQPRPISCRRNHKLLTTMRYR